MNTITPETAGDGHITHEMIEKLSSKLSELIGDEAIKDYECLRDKRGEVRFSGSPHTLHSRPIFSL